MLMILARLVRSESFWAVVKVRSPHTGPEPWNKKFFGCLECVPGGRRQDRPPRRAEQSLRRQCSPSPGYSRYS